jgi:hypothetical protein
MTYGRILSDRAKIKSAGGASECPLFAHCGRALPRSPAVLAVARLAAARQPQDHVAVAFARPAEPAEFVLAHMAQMRAICSRSIESVSAPAPMPNTALRKTDTWQQAAYVEKGGWAVMPGSKVADSGVPQACAALLSNLK